MKEFDEIQKIWQQQPVPAIKKNTKEIIEDAKKEQHQLAKKQLYPGIILLAGVFILFWMISYIVFKLQSTYLSLFFLSLVLLIQSVVNFITFQKLRKLSVTQNAKAHLRNWEEYYQFRMKSFAINTPLYFICINIGIIIYYFEMLINYVLVYKLILLLLYVIAMLFIYFMWVKKIMEREKNRLLQIIDNLSSVENQIDTQ